MKRQYLYHVTRVFAVSWMTTIICFGFLLFSFTKIPESSSHHRALEVLFIGDIVMGIVSFVVMVISYIFEPKHKQSSSQKILNKIIRQSKPIHPIWKYSTIIFGCILFLLIGKYSIDLAFLNWQASHNTKSTLTTSVTPTPTAPTNTILDGFQIFKSINEYREQKSLAKIYLDKESCDIANRIINNDWWTKSISLEDFNDLCPTCSAMGLSQSVDNPTVAQIINQWASSSDTSINLTGAYQYGCAATKGDKVAFVVVNKAKNNSTSFIPVNTISPDTPVHCPINEKCGGGTTPLKKNECDNSICCEIKGEWIFYKDKAQCTKDQQSNNQITVPNYKNTYVDNSITCVVSYPCTGNTYTYRLLPADCVNAQNQASQLCNSSSFSTSTTTPTITEEQAQSIIDQHNSQVTRCRNDVINAYSSLIQSCNIQFGSSSAADACVRIYEDKRQNDYNACGSKY